MIGFFYASLGKQVAYAGRTYGFTLVCACLTTHHLDAYLLSVAYIIVEPLGTPVSETVVVTDDQYRHMQLVAQTCCMKSRADMAAICEVKSSTATSSIPAWRSRAVRSSVVFSTGTSPHLSTLLGEAAKVTATALMPRTSAMLRTWASRLR